MSGQRVSLELSDQYRNDKKSRIGKSSSQQSDRCDWQLLWLPPLWMLPWGWGWGGVHTGQRLDNECVQSLRMGGLCEVAL